MAIYNNKETIARMAIDVITTVIRKIRRIRKPSPKLVDWNSPTTTPTNDSPTLTFKVGSSSHTAGLYDFRPDGNATLTDEEHAASLNTFMTSFGDVMQTQEAVSRLTKRVIL
ncbi:MAG: hypothetical protein QOF90_378 [Acetobacteraceae bacterium]|nr:hypothetical protein [Acetobacteraceae bacterium]